MADFWSLQFSLRPKCALGLGHSKAKFGGLRFLFGGRFTMNLIVFSYSLGLCNSEAFMSRWGDF